VTIDGHRPLAVIRYHVTAPSPFHPMVGGSSVYLAWSRKTGAPHPTLALWPQGLAEFPDPKPITCPPNCTHTSSPTQMNRALERISPKPMVDGFVKIFRWISEWVRWKKRYDIATLRMHWSCFSANWDELNKLRRTFICFVHFQFEAKARPACSSKLKINN